MKKLLPAFFLLAFFETAAQKQEFTLGTLVRFTSLPGDEFAAYIARKGYKPQASDTLMAFCKQSKDKTIEKLIGKMENSQTASVLFQTTSWDEFLMMNRELQEAGYSFSAQHTLCPGVYALYQKGSITIKPQIKKTEEKTTYCLLVERRQLPLRTSLVYAEDLLQLQSHEYLVAVFGEANVQKDVFYFSETELSRCSILFPKTAMQVIFVWKDEAYSRGISLLVFGGSNGSEKESSFYKPVQWGKWPSRQGLYPGMPLKELQQLNGNSLNFYGWESEESGFVMRDNQGKIDFRKIGIQLHCLNCNEDRFYSNTSVLNSATLIQQNRQVYVSTMILVPDEPVSEPGP